MEVGLPVHAHTHMYVHTTLSGVMRFLLSLVFSSRSQGEMTELIQELKDIVDNKQKPKPSTAKGTTGLCGCAGVHLEGHGAHSQPATHPPLEGKGHPRSLTFCM